MNPNTIKETRLPIATEYATDRVVHVYENGDTDVMPWEAFDRARVPTALDILAHHLAKQEVKR